MRNFLQITVILLMSNIVFAQSTVETLVLDVVDFIVEPLIALVFGAGVLMFLFGLARYIASGKNPEQRKIGAQHMLWGVVGLTIMAAVWGIIEIIENTIGF